MNIKAFFPCGGGSNLILERGRKNQIFFSENLCCCQVFSLNSGISPQLFILQEKNLIFPGRYLKADHFEKKNEQGRWENAEG